MSHTIRLHRVLCAPADRIYRAFITPEALGKWLPPHGFVCAVHELDARVGGRFRMSFINLGNGQAHSFGGEYLQLVPGERLQYSDVFDDPNLPGTLITTVELKPVSCGTAVSIVQEGVPAVIPEEGCYVGWQQSLQLLALLVEAEIPG
ncbi:MAG TPA: SRPBCC family protein [Fluviicoccus sp.]|nr:SRPBCC family protein [Fluviicoccus sp.]